MIEYESVAVYDTDTPEDKAQRDRQWVYLKYLEDVADRNYWWGMGVGFAIGGIVASLLWWVSVRFWLMQLAGVIGAP